MKLDRVILSSDDNLKFIEFWPLVAEAWRKLFEVDVWLAVVSWCYGKAALRKLKEHGYVEVYAPIEGIPIANQAKIARYHLASIWNDASVVMTNDIDLLPLQSAYVHDLLHQRPPGHLLTVGAELYTGPEKGKFTAGYLTAESSVWSKLVNPLHLAWPAFIKSFVGMSEIDYKEDISRTVHHEEPDTFSDESLLRALLKMNPVPVIYARRGFEPYTARALCRSDWKLDPGKLKNNEYVEAHLPRPWHDHVDKIKPLAEYLKTAQ